MRKELKQKAFEMGYKAFPKLNVSPSLNHEFLKEIPSCCKLREELFKKYINGWVRAFIDKICSN